ncbi:MAG: hypothetical protein RL689_742, partial [Planctomycetota bacterium]
MANVPSGPGRMLPRSLAGYRPCAQTGAAGVVRF